MKRVIKHICRLAICLLTFGCISEPTEEPSRKSLGPNDRLPDFSVGMSDGSVVSTADLQQKVSLVCFFRISCPDCREELPVLQQIYEEYAAEIGMILISTREGQEDIDRYWSQNGLTLPRTLNPEPGLADVFGVSRVPQVYVSGRDGVIRYVHSDNPIASYESLKKELESLLAE